MAERTMSEALSAGRPAADAASTAFRDVAAKRRAILEPEVDAFIKAGAAIQGGQELSHRTSAPGHLNMQLNTKIPASLYHRARRAVFECHMSKTDPRTIQDLVSQALHAELKRLGF